MNEPLCLMTREEFREWLSENGQSVDRRKNSKWSDKNKSLAESLE